METSPLGGKATCPFDLSEVITLCSSISRPCSYDRGEGKVLITRNNHGAIVLKEMILSL